MATLPVNCMYEATNTPEEAKSIPRAIWKGKSLKPALIPHPGSALGVNFVLTSPEEVVALHQPAGL